MTSFARRPPVGALVITITLALVSACSGSADEEASLTPMPDSGITTLQSRDVVVGDGDEARPGRTVQVHYTGWLYDASQPENRGREFDSSVDGDEPFAFEIGAGEVIPGWDQGVAGMREGGTRVLTIPPPMAYGASGVPGLIPPNATLVFEIRLLDVR